MINGRKQFISNGYDAGLFVVYANTNPKVGMLQGTSRFLVPRDTPGLTIARCNETLGCRFMNNGELVFEDMRVPEDHLLVENDALAQGRRLFPARQDHPGGEEPRRRRARLRGDRRLCAELRAGRPHPDQAPGGGAAARRHGDQASRRRARSLRDAAAAVDDNAPDADALCNMAKLFASEEILKVAQHAVELHGGNGMMLDFGVEKLLRDAAIFPHMDGTVDISKFKIVKSMFPHTAGKYAGPENSPSVMGVANTPALRCRPRAGENP